MTYRRQAVLAAVGALGLSMLCAAVFDCVEVWLSARAELEQVAHSIDQRSLLVRKESLELAKLMPAGTGCNQALLRRILARAHYVKNVGKIAGTRVYCDALDGAAANIDLGPAKVTRSDGVRVWATVRGLWAARGSDVVMIDPASFVDAVLPSQTVVALVEIESGRMLVHSSPLPPALIRTAWVAGPGALTANGFLVAVSESIDRRTLDVAARPIAAVRAQAWSALPRFLLAGAGFGVPLAAALIFALGRRRSLMSELRRALKLRQLRVVLQPIVSLASGDTRVVGFECLARWRLADEADISPAVFVPMVEAAGLGSELARCVIANLVTDFGAILLKHPELHVAVNLSSADVADARLLDDINSLLAAGGIPPGQVVIELTERIFEADGLEQGLERLRVAGHRLSIDDFGTGASNASRLASFRPEMVKVDRSFLVHAERGGQAAALLPQLVAMASGCGAKVVIEGVETQPQAELVAAFGEVLGQGYFWHRPMDAAQASRLIESQPPLSQRGETMIA